MSFIAVAIAGCASFQKADYDKEVDRFCTLDGGNTVYQTIALPSTVFDKYGFPKLNNDDFKFNLGSDYSITQKSELVIGIDSSENTPYIRRNSYLVMRNSDSLLLGKNINYVRAGGDGAFTLLPSAHSCAEGNVDLIKQIFIKETQ